MAFIILIPRTAQGENHYWSQLAHSFFLTYSKLIFIIGLAILILPSLLGIDTLVMFVLDTKAFNFMAKISFCTYLIHLTIIYAWIGSIKIDFYYSYVPLFSIGAAMAIISMTLGFILSVLV
jgi:peptidoglycan/LPS O-acetylase OafA/YrhL